MSHASMLKTRRNKQYAKKQLRRVQKQAQRERNARKATPSTP